MTGEPTLDAVEVRHVAWNVFLQLRFPPLPVLAYSRAVLRFEARRIEPPMPRLRLEDDDRFGRIDLRFEEKVQIEEIAALQALQDAPELFASDLQKCVNAHCSIIGQIWPARQESTKLRFYHEFVVSQVELELPLAAQRPEVGDPGRLIVSETEPLDDASCRAE